MKPIDDLIEGDVLVVALPTRLEVVGRDEVTGAVRFRPLDDPAGAEVLLTRDEIERGVVERDPHYYKVMKRSRSERIVELLKESPQRSISEITAIIYGECTKSTRAKVRALLSQLKRFKRVRNVSPGHWEAA